MLRCKTAWLILWLCYLWGTDVPNKDYYACTHKNQNNTHTHTLRSSRIVQNSSVDQNHGSRWQLFWESIMSCNDFLQDTMKKKKTVPLNKLFHLKQSNQSSNGRWPLATLIDYFPIRPLSKAFHLLMIIFSPTEPRVLNPLCRSIGCRVIPRSGTRHPLLREIHPAQERRKVT